MNNKLPIGNEVPVSDEQYSDIYSKMALQLTDKVAHEFKSMGAGKAFEDQFIDKVAAEIYRICS